MTTPAQREALVAMQSTYIRELFAAREAAAYRRGWEAARERADEAGQQAVWDADERERKAISKGSAPYSLEFRTANTAQSVGEAIRALEPEPGEGQ